MRDIAEAAGVSRSTVSLVMAGSPLIPVQTRERVTETVRRLGYVYNRNAANLRKARSNMVGLIINDLTNPYFAEVAVGCERVLQAAGHICFIANTSENPVRQAEVLRLMREQGVAGIIACPARGTVSDAFDAMTQSGLPVVLAIRRLERARAALVVPDNVKGASEAVKHLAGLGHRRIAFIGGFEDVAARQDRLAGFRAGLELAGIGFDAALAPNGPPTRDFGASSVALFRRGGNPPTAVLAFNDAVALGICQGLRRDGLEPGRDIAVIGFDDIAEARYAAPALTTVAVDPQGVGERAAQMVLRMIGNGRSDTEEHIGAVHLVVRESCGAKYAAQQGEMRA
jgi:LacI family transcriptional regulator